MNPLIIIPIFIVVATQYVLLQRYDFRCGNCGHVFSSSFGAVLLTPHSFEESCCMSRVRKVHVGCTGTQGAIAQRPPYGSVKAAGTS